MIALELTLGLFLAAAPQDAPPAPAPIPRSEPQAGFPGLPAGRSPRVEIPWNRLYDLPELYGHFDRLVAAYPDTLSREVIGTSVGGRELRVYTLNDPATGPAASKPAMWIDGNVHGNETQASETVLYAAWYLLENRETNEQVAELCAGSAFYLCPSVNPDGRAYWFNAANGSSSSRSGIQPTDSDRDGLFDEDPSNDLDGDGNIVQMRKYAPGEGTYRLNPDDPRILDYVGSDPEGEPGDWLMLGSEGIDDDGDGRFNEDGVGGYDMNRAWPSSWQPGHVQSGAGDYPLYWPETRSIAHFILAHPNIAAAQSFHNSGGMILRGPGTEEYGEFPSADVTVYDKIGADGEKMLPFYDYMILYRDLYTVYGGFVNWTYEGLGIFSFTNELWTSRRNSPDERLERSGEDRHFFDDHLLMGAGFVDWHPYSHPFYGEVEIGGFAKDVGRVPPTFLMEEMLHRNALFCLRHAAAMPRVEIEEPEVTDLGGGLYALDVVLRNRGEIPTRAALATRRGMGSPDLVTLEGPSIEVLSGGVRGDIWRPERIRLAEHQPARLVRDAGLFRGNPLRIRWFLRGSGTFEIGWSGQKARDVRLPGQLP